MCERILKEVVGEEGGRSRRPQSTVSSVSSQHLFKLKVNTIGAFSSTTQSLLNTISWFRRISPVLIFEVTHTCQTQLTF